MTKKIRPNEPCPCGSGRKFKKCCGGPNSKPAIAGLPHTQAERASAFDKLDFFVDELYEEEEEAAFELFWDRHLEREDELPPEFLAISNDVQEVWFAFDHELDDGVRLIDEFLEQAQLTRGERSFLTALQKSSMRLYEVTEAVPGTSITLRDIIEGSVVTVSERTASRTVAHHDCLAARVIGRGCSGQPELERGALHISPMLREQVVAQVRKFRNEFLLERTGAPLDDFYKTLPPFFHDVWLTSIFEPIVPTLLNADGDEMVITRVSFVVKDERTLLQALASAEQQGLSRDGDSSWCWSSKNPSGEERSLAKLELREGILTVEANSVARGKRAREFVEGLAESAIQHRATTHEDLRRKVAEGVTAHVLGRETVDDEIEPSSPEIDPELAESVVMDYYARHYRNWVDEPVPALDGYTPRAAAKNAELRARVEDLIHGLESIYERALKDGKSAYDPSWMWGELGLLTLPDVSRPSPMAHERVAERVPGSAEVSRACAERARAMPAFSDSRTTLSDEDIQHDLELQRFLRRNRPAENDGGQDGSVASPYIALMVNLDLHRRKVFWVDEALSFMLENTDTDVTWQELRVPFPSFALVFTDRHTLSLGERLLARHSKDPLRGQILRAATVYVTERHNTSGRLLEIVFALDALGADLPSLVRYEIPVHDGEAIRQYLDSVAPRSRVEPEVQDTSPARGLLRLVFNAILYATSAGVAPEVRPIVSHRRSPSERAPQPSDSVFFLPGKIDIRAVRQLQELRRAPQGGQLLSRFMVRGHWRRPAKNWTEQRLRWIEPYWKGPDMAAIIEKAYRLKL